MRAIFVSHDRGAAEMYRVKLEVDGYHTSVTTPADLAALLRTDPPDIIFLDMRQRADALALYRALRADPQNGIPIVLLSHYSAVELAKQHVLVRSFDFVIRSFREYNLTLTPFGSN